MTAIDRPQRHPITHQRKLFSAGFLLYTVSLLFINSAHAEWINDAFDVMGTQARIEIWSNQQERALKQIEQVKSILNSVDQRMSPYKETSQISKINQLPPHQSYQLTDDVAHVISRALHFSSLTAGAFDITFASVGHQFDYRNKTLPDQTKLTSGLKQINYKNLSLTDNQLSKEAELTIDLGGIAKGFAVDQAIDYLAEQGVQHAYLLVGGDSRYLGDRHGRPWMIGIRHPRKPSGSVLTLPLENTALSTSGDYERYFIDDQGVRHHHIINPKTGHSPHEVISVTVLGNDTTTTDALSTSVFVLGIEKGLALIETLPDNDAVIIDNQGRIHYTSNLMPPPSQATHSVDCGAESSCTK